MTYIIPMYKEVGVELIDYYLIHTTRSSFTDKQKKAHKIMAEQLKKGVHKYSHYLAICHRLDIGPRSERVFDDYYYTYVYITPFD